VNFSNKEGKLSIYLSFRVSFMFPALNITNQHAWKLCQNFTDKIHFPIYKRDVIRTRKSIFPTRKRREFYPLGIPNSLAHAPCTIRVDGRLLPTEVVLVQTEGCVKQIHCDFYLILRKKKPIGCRNCTFI